MQGKANVHNIFTLVVHPSVVVAGWGSHALLWHISSITSTWDHLASIKWLQLIAQRVSSPQADTNASKESVINLNKSS